jgi:hypothetical protein
MAKGKGWFQEPQREAAFRRYCERLPDQTNAAMTGCSIHTIESWKRKDRWRLRRREWKASLSVGIPGIATASISYSSESEAGGEAEKPYEKTYVRADGRTGLCSRSGLSRRARKGDVPRPNIESMPDYSPGPDRKWTYDVHLETWTSEDSEDL